MRSMPLLRGLLRAPPRSAARSATLHRVGIEPLRDPIGERRSLDQLQDECATTASVFDAQDAADVADGSGRGECSRLALRDRAMRSGSAADQLGQDT